MPTTELSAVGNVDMIVNFQTADSRKGAFHMDYIDYCRRVLSKPMIHPEHLEMVLEAVQKAIPLMQYGERYTLPELVGLVDECKWTQLKRGDRGRVGRRFSCMVGMGEILKLKRAKNKSATKVYKLAQR